MHMLISVSNQGAIVCVGLLDRGIVPSAIMIRPVDRAPSREVCGLV